MTTTVELAPARPRHDVRTIDRRANNMQHVLDALHNIAVDAAAIADGTIPYGLGYDIARRANSLAAELELFRARDLINMRVAS